METVGFKGGDVYGVRTLKDVLSIVCDRENKKKFLIDRNPASVKEEPDRQDADVMDFSEIIGQEAAKHGLEIAACGGHNAILIGPPGSGKSSLAKAMCRILPPMSPLDDEYKAFLENISTQMGLSARACFKIVKLARTIADMAKVADISVSHLSEAVSYRFLDKVKLHE